MVLPIKVSVFRMWRISFFFWVLFGGSGRKRESGLTGSEIGLKSVGMSIRWISNDLESLSSLLPSSQPYLSILPLAFYLFPPVYTPLIFAVHCFLFCSFSSSFSSRHMWKERYLITKNEKGRKKGREGRKEEKKHYFGFCCLLVLAKSLSPDVCSYGLVPKR